MSCSGGGGDGGNGGGGGGGTPEASVIIGPSGGVVEVTNPSSPLYGVKVEVPAGALDSDTTISIGIRESALSLPTHVDKISEIILLEPEGLFFNIPAIISIPFNAQNVADQNMLVVYLYDEGTLSCDTLTVTNISNGIIVAETRHFSSLAVAEIKTILDEATTDFSLNKDGFSILNYTECAGMVAFAGWYFENKKEQHGHLRDKYPDECVQEQIAKEAQRYAVSSPGWALPHIQIANTLMNDLREKKLQVIGLLNMVNHAVLVYKYEKIYSANQGTYVIFYVYDPNFPDASQTIIFRYSTSDTGYFEPYDGYTKFAYISRHSMFNGEKLESIFNLDMMPKIENMQPTGTISSKRPTISATIKSSQRDIDISAANMFLLDDHTVSYSTIGSGREVTFSYTPNYDLSEGAHRVDVAAYNVEGIFSCPGSWTFNIEEECANIAGDWDTSETATVTCTIDGVTETETVSGTDTITIEQNGCNIHWEVFGYDRTGAVEGTNLHVSGVFMFGEGDVSFTQNIWSAEGTIIGGDEIHLNASGSAAGTYCDEEGCRSFSCSTIEDTAVFTRSTSTSPLSTMGKKKAEQKPTSLFMNNSLRILTTISH